jgi:hypothetical protein
MGQPSVAPPAGPTLALTLTYVVDTVSDSVPPYYRRRCTTKISRERAWHAQFGIDNSTLVTDFKKKKGKVFDCGFSRVDSTWKLLHILAF